MKSGEMTGRNIRRNISLLVGLFMIVTFSSLSYGDTDLGEQLGVLDKGELNRIVGEAERVLAKNPKDKDSLLKLGMAYHNLANLGVRDAATKGVDYLKQADKLYSDDPLILAVLGSVVTILGREASNMVDKMRYVNEGTPLIDRAVNKAPDNVYIRLIRSDNSAGLPKMFGRGHFVKQDLLHIEEIIKRAPKEVPVTCQAKA